MIKNLCGFLCFLFVAVAQGQNIDVVEEELARESVLPKFEVSSSVRNRLVKLKGRFELGAYAGYSSDEPFYSQLNYGFLGGYHFNEVHGVHLTAGAFPTGLSSYVNDLPSPTNDQVKAAPQVSNFWLLNYQFSGFYGKMSLGKKLELNTSLYAMLGVGKLLVGSKDYLAYDLGIGQKFYVSPDWALRFDLKLISFNGPNPLYVRPGATAPYSLEDYQESSFYRTHLSFGLVFLL